MTHRFLKHVESGVIYMYVEPWIGREGFIEVANAAGDPLPEPKGEAVVNLGSRRKPKVTAEPAQEMPTEYELAQAGLSADASRGL